MKLIILNGPTGVGKSTLAARLHREMPSSVLIDIDELRRTIPDYRERREESLRQAYELAAKSIEENLEVGKDVIIDKTIGDTNVLDRFVATAQECGADACELLLFADKGTVRARADARGYKPGGLLTPERVEEHWERANELRGLRKKALVIDTTGLRPDEVFSATLAALA